MSIEAGLGHVFADRDLLALALTHRSAAVDDEETSDNERLEFLGDAVLQLVVTDRLYHQYPDMSEGQMAKVRAAVVSGATLAEVAHTMDLGAHINLSPAEERSGGRSKRSILADALEATIGAVYLDAGYHAAEQVVLRLWGGRIAEKAANPGIRDYKTRLQELLAATGRRPEYRVAGTGPDHAREFAAAVLVDGEVIGEGVGRSKKAAEQAAAEEAISSLGRSVS